MLKLNKKFNKMQFNEVIDIRKKHTVFEYLLKDEVKDIKDYIFIHISFKYKLKYLKNDYKILKKYRYKQFTQSKIILYTREDL